MHKILFALVIAAGGLSGAPILSNLPLANTNVGTGTSASGGTIQYAFGFTIPTGTNYRLDSVDVELRRHLGTLPNGNLFGFALYETTPTSGSPLTTFQLPATISTTVALYNLTPLLPTTLVGGETYWVLYTTTGGGANGGVAWYGSDTNAAPIGVATPASNSYVVVNNTIFQNTGSDALGYQVNATATPEPSTTVILATGLATILAVRRRRRLTS